MPVAAVLRLAAVTVVPRLAAVTVGAAGGGDGWAATRARGGVGTACDRWLIRDSD